MRSQWFGTIFAFLSLQKSAAIIAGCNYLDTIDISDLKWDNDSYKYGDLVIPANLTGVYGCREGPNGSHKPVENHLRACICKLRQCVPICCPLKDMLANGACNDGLEKEISRLNPYLNVTLEDGSIEARYFSKDLILVRRPFYSCPELNILKENEYSLFENGSFSHQSADNSIFDKDNYCLYPRHLSSDSTKTIWILNSHYRFYLLPLFKEVFVISQLCYMMTLAVYVYVKKLRNLLGKCFICCLFNRIIMNCMLVRIILWNSCRVDSSTEGYIIYFLRRSDGFWLCVISYHTWQRMKLVNTKMIESRYQLLANCIFTWGTGALMTVAIFVMDQIWETDTDKFEWRSGVAVSKCRLQSVRWSQFIYVSGPEAILNTFIFVMFILTAIQILKVKRQLKEFGRHQKINIISDKGTYLQFIRLSGLMGVTYILDLVYPLANIYDSSKWLSYFSMPVSYFHSGSGIVIFWLFILKRSTFHLIMERYRG